MIEIVPSTIHHAWELINTLREEDKEEIRAAGGIPNKAVFDAYEKSILRKTLLIDNKVSAMWGVYGSFLGLTGIPYFLTGTEINKLHPIRFARIYKDEVQEMKKIFPVLENYVDARYKGAIRMLKIAGFTVSEPIKINRNDFCMFRLV